MSFFYRSVGLLKTSASFCRSIRSQRTSTLKFVSRSISITKQLLYNKPELYGRFVLSRWCNIYRNRHWKIAPNVMGALSAASIMRSLGISHRKPGKSHRLSKEQVVVRGVQFCPSCQKRLTYGLIIHLRSLLRLIGIAFQSPALCYTISALTFIGSFGRSECSIYSHTACEAGSSKWYGRKSTVKSGPSPLLQRRTALLPNNYAFAFYPPDKRPQWRHCTPADCRLYSVVPSEFLVREAARILRFLFIFGELVETIFVIS